MDSCGGWKREVWTGRDIRRQLQGKGAQPWTSERRNGLARGIYSRLREDGRFVEKEALNEIQYCMNTTLRHSGFFAYQLVFGANPMDLYPWEDDDREFNFAQNASVSSQFTSQWKLLVMTQESHVGRNGQKPIATHIGS